MEKLTNRTMWDYSDLKFNIGKYIALEIALVWGFMSLIIVYLVKPWLDKIIIKIPRLITYSVFFIFTADILISIFNKI